MALPANITVMLKAASKAGRGLVRDFGEVEKLQVSQKGPRDFVSEADMRSEAVIREELTKARPDYSLLMEESGETIGEDPTYRWIVDPLDGTTNFLHGLPHFCIAIALEKRENGKSEIISALVHAPVLQETFWAEKGQGAYLSGQHGDIRLRVAARRNVGDALIATASILKGHEKSFAAHTLSPHVVGIRALGSAALDLAYTAAGRYDLFAHKGAKIWDYAPGILMVKEAGGIVTDLSNKYNMLDQREILAGNEKLHAQAINLLKQASAA